MDTRPHTLSKRARRTVALALIVAIGVSSVSAGLIITTGSGITATGVDGITYNGSSGIARACFKCARRCRESHVGLDVGTR